MKIVAIGGENNSNIKKNGNFQQYEHESIDTAIINLSGKKHPNVLFISHASDETEEQASYNKIVNTYNKMYSCPTKLLDRKTLNDLETVEQLLAWSDIIYIGGGNTKEMLDLWKKQDLISN